jgi:hypothetical protein
VNVSPDHDKRESFKTMQTSFNESGVCFEVSPEELKIIPPMHVLGRTKSLSFPISMMKNQVEISLPVKNKYSNDFDSSEFIDDIREKIGASPRL